MAQLTYNPDVFRVRSEREAREIILTTEGGLKTDERWVRETPYLGELLSQHLAVAPGNVVVDFGCGIGRMSRELIERLGCSVIGVDISADMRALAPGYVNSECFSAVSATMFETMVERGLRVDAAISIWVLQHCLNPVADIERIGRSLKPGGRFIVVNNKSRAVPTKEKAWASDGLDVRGVLQQHFEELQDGALDPSVVTQHVSNATFWGAYRNMG